ncbi:MAG TPA: hypothetical protein VGV38_05270 [Pyrinomonadaceae bacterium]|nr:hypothetical protein [Pyrinomonadaceae bacterium]
MAETFNWVKPSPLWSSNGSDMARRDFFRPPLMQFTGDDFMEQFFAAVAAPRPNAFEQAVSAAAGSNVKLFQPAHGRYYLTCASLCCRLPGFPDREVRRGDGESVFFVLRKKLGSTEYAWVADETGAKTWQPAAPRADLLQEGEERLPLMPARTSKNRPVHFGFIPVASRETYKAESADSPVQIETSDPRRGEFNEKITAALDALLDMKANIGGSPSTAQNTIANETTLFLLLDFADFLKLNAPDVFTHLPDSLPPANFSQKKKDLLNYLYGIRFQSGNTRFSDAITDVDSIRSTLSNLDPDASPPRGYNVWYIASGTLAATGPNSPEAKVFPESQPPYQVLTPYVAPTAPAPVPVPRFSPFKNEAQDFYVLRYVYERAQCDPPHRYVSLPTQTFTLASFFDPDAPGRDIRIQLPTDVSIAGLRKFPKNVAFMMSADLRNKMAAIAGKETDILDGDEPGSEGGFTVGHICSFSIPIITICAFIVLMIFLVLLNIIFWWLPFLKICFPILVPKKD